MATQHARVAEMGNNKIRAIKLVRELSGQGLAEAKRSVEVGRPFEVQLPAPRIRELLDRPGYGSVALVFDPPLPGSPGSGPASAPDTGVSPGAGALRLRYLHGPKKIHAIKLVRELTGLGLKQAKDLVEQSGVVRGGLSRTEAEALAARFAEIDAQVVIETGEAGEAGQRAPEDTRPQLPAPGSTTVGFVEDDDDLDF